MGLDLITQMRNELIEARTKEEQKLAEFAKALSSVDVVEVFSGIPIPTDFTLKAFCPEAYSDNPDPTAYAEQYEKLSRICASINERITSYNSEALECLQQFKQIK